MTSRTRRAAVALAATGLIALAEFGAGPAPWDAATAVVGPTHIPWDPATAVVGPTHIPWDAATVALPMPRAVSPDPRAIPSGATGVLTLRVLANTPAGAGGLAVPGRVFTVTAVRGVDLRTHAGWSLVAAYREGRSIPPESLGSARTTAPTDAAGQTEIDGLPVGLYLVRDVTPAAGNRSQPPAADLLVTIPQPDPQSGSWSYQVTAYPKTPTVGITKAVADGNVGRPGEDAPVAGRVLTYTLTTDIPGDGLRGLGGTCVRGAAVDTGPVGTAPGSPRPGSAIPRRPTSAWPPARRTRSSTT